MMLVFKSEDIYEAEDSEIVIFQHAACVLMELTLLLISQL
jgi:hypothetical protein